MGHVRLAIVGAAHFVSIRLDDVDVNLGTEIAPRANDRELSERMTAINEA